MEKAVFYKELTTASSFAFASKPSFEFHLCARRDKMDFVDVIFQHLELKGIEEKLLPISVMSCFAQFVPIFNNLPISVRASLEST